MTRKGSWSGYAKAADWDTFSTKEKLDDILKRLNFITTQEAHKEFRTRYQTTEQFEEEYGPESGYNEMLSYMWFSAKEDYCQYKDEFDTWLKSNPQSQYYMQTIEAMKNVIDDEIEETLLGDSTDSNSNQINEEDPCEE